MPTFDFACDTCGHTFEFSRPYGSKEHPACPQCRNKKTRKLISPPQIQFRGSGFYKTDAAKKTPVKKEAKKMEAGSKKETTTEVKTTEKMDSKPQTSNQKPGNQ